MTSCSWAACTAPAKHDDGTYKHCAPHWQQHLAFEEEDAIRSRLSAPRAPMPAKERNRQRIIDVQTCVALGMDTNEIAQHLKLSTAYVRDLRREAGVAQPPKQAQCGTRAGLERHHTRGETPCEPCVEARRQYDRERYGRRRRAAA